MKNIYKALLIISGVLVVVTVTLYFIGLWRMNEKAKTAAAIENINATKITLDDLMGKHLPPRPDQAANDATVAGIDANGNLVRDDVELYIFEQYPNSARTRAAMLQYAQAMQIELTQVFNSDVYIASIVKEANGSLCIVENTHKTDASDIIEDLILNTNLRKEKKSTNLKDYLRTYSVRAGERCDINPSVLPN